MVSKAPDKSSNTSLAPLPLPIVVTISLYTLNDAVSQLCPYFKQTEKYQQYEFYQMGSNSFFIIKKKMTGLKLANIFLNLRIQKMIADLEDAGKTTDEKQRKIILHIEDK